MRYTIYHKIAWFLCFLGSVFPLYFGAMTFYAMFTQNPENAISVDNFDKSLMMIQGFMSFGVGAICLGIAAIIDLLSSEPI